MAAFAGGERRGRFRNTTETKDGDGDRDALIEYQGIKNGHTNNV